MKRYLLFSLFVLLLLLPVMVFPIDFGGSTEAIGIINDQEEAKLELTQDIDIDVGPLHADINVGVDVSPYAEAPLAYDWLIGADVTVSYFKIGASVKSIKDIIADEVKGFIDFAVGKIGADLDIFITADPDEQIFQGADFSAFYNPGPLEFRIGYFLSETGIGESNAPDVTTNGGVYSKVKITY